MVTSSNLISIIGICGETMHYYCSSQGHLVKILMTQIISSSLRESGHEAKDFAVILFFIPIKADQFCLSPPPVFICQFVIYKSRI